MATPAVTEPRVALIRQILADLVHQRQSLRGATDSPEKMLLEAIAQCDRGETTPMGDFLAELRSRE